MTHDIITTFVYASLLTALFCGLFYAVVRQYNVNSKTREGIAAAFVVAVLLAAVLIL